MKFTAEQNDFRQSVRTFVDREINPNIEEWESAGMMPLHKLFAKAAEVGMMGLNYDEEYGGQGEDDPTYMMILAEEVGRAQHGSFPMAFGSHVQMATPSLHRYGTHEQKMQYLKPAMEGAMVAAIAVSEPEAGSDVASIRTRAVRDGDDWVINGSKMWITNSLQADWLCLLARTNDEGGYRGCSQIIVPTSTPGFSVARKIDKLGMRASDTGVLAFDDMRVPVANTIGEIDRGFQQQMAQFDIERMWAAFGIPAKCDHYLQMTRDYARERKMFGGSLMSMQYWGYKMAELSAEIDLLRVYNQHVCEMIKNDEDISKEASIAKLTAGRLSQKVVDWCVQMHGGMGYVEEGWTGRAYRDSRLTRIAGGSDETMLRVLMRKGGFQ
ncbi:MAG: acyl-CoA dehydrogenase family protein [Antricoccus sp.]